jgi:hypothetical protein
MKLPFARLIPACFLLALPGAALSAEISVDATSIVRFEQRADQGVPKKDIMPATQFLGLEATKLGDGNLSLHLYGWGRYDLADKSYNNDQAAGQLTYGYLQYRFKAANANIRAGRFFVHEGIVNEQIDGISFQTDLPAGFGFSAFGGANVHTQHLYNVSSDGKGDYNVGGRVNYRYKGVLELGVSGQYETDAPTLIGYPPLNIYPTADHRMVGGDVWFSPHKSVEISGHTSYNTVTKGVAEHSYLMNIKPIQHLVLTGEYNDHRERNYMYTWLSFYKTLDLNNPNHRSHSVGTRASYEVSKMVELTADYKHYTQAGNAERFGGSADRYGGDVKLSFLNNSVRSGLGYHYLNADRNFAISGTGNASASYHELRAYAMQDTKTYFAAVDVIDYIFKDKVYNTTDVWEAMVSLGYHITPKLALSGDVSYGKNPQYDEEIKGLIRLTYNGNYTFSDSKGGMK